MRSYSLYILSLIGLASCKKEHDTNLTTSEQDSIREITYSTDPEDVLANKSTETLLDHLESKQQELQLKLKTVKNKQEGDLLFNEYQKSFATIVDSLNSSESLTLKQYGNWSTDSKPDSVFVKEKRLKKLGIFIRNIDSNYYDIKMVPGFYHKLFKNKVSYELQDYLSLVAKSNQLNFDVQMNVKQFDITKYRDIALAWETYLKKYPKSSQKEKVNRFYQEVMMTYLFGFKNNKTFEPVSKKIDPQIEQEYIVLMKKYPKSKTAEITKEFMKFFYANDQVQNSNNFYKDLQNRTKEEINRRLAL